MHAEGVIYLLSSLLSVRECAPSVRRVDVDQYQQQLVLDRARDARLSCRGHHARSHFVKDQDMLTTDPSAVACTASWQSLRFSRSVHWMASRRR